MPEIIHEIKVEGTPADVLHALTTLEGVTSWQTPHVSGDGAVGTPWEFRFTGRPSFVWQVEASGPERVQWRCAAGPGDAVGTTVTFDISETDDGRTLVELAHSGWAGTHGNFRKCNTLWGVLLFHLARAVRTGTPAPAFD